MGGSRSDAQFEQELDEAEEYLRAYITCCLDNPHCAELLVAPERVQILQPLMVGYIMSLLEDVGSLLQPPRSAKEVWGQFCLAKAQEG